MLIASLLLAASFGAPTPPPTDETAWLFTDVDSGLARAEEQDTLLLIYVWMNASPQCQRMYSETLVAPAVQAELDGLVCLSVDAIEPRGRSIIERYGVTTLPTLLFVKPDIGVEDAAFGFVPAASLVGEIQRIKAGRNTVTSLRAEAAAAPKDLGVRHRLARKLALLGATAESDVLLDSIRRDDPKQKTLIGAQLRLWDLIAAAVDPSDEAIDPRPVRTYLESTRHTEVLFEGWEWIAGVERDRGRGVAARRALASAWKNVDDTRAVEWGTQTVWRLWEIRGDLEAPDKAWALSVAKDVVKRSESALGELESATDEQRGRLANGLGALAIAYHMHGQTKKGLAQLDRAVELAPNNPELQSRRALLLADN